MAAVPDLSDWLTKHRDRLGLFESGIPVLPAGRSASTVGKIGTSFLSAASSARYDFIEGFLLFEANQSASQSTVSTASTMVYSWPASVVETGFMQTCRDMCPGDGHKRNVCYVFAVLESIFRAGSIFQESQQFSCARVYCCVFFDGQKYFVIASAFPLLEIFFTMLKAFSKVVSSSSEYAPQLDAALSKINERGLCKYTLGKFSTCGIAIQPKFKVYKPRPDALESLAAGAVKRHSFEERVMMRWVSEWALSVLIQNPLTHSLFGEKLAHLLACVLLDRRIVLVGSKDLASALALALVSLIWPFRWLHMLLPVVSPSMMDVPLFTAPVPFIVGTDYIPDTWMSEPCEEDVLCVNIEGEFHFSNPRLPGHDELCRELESALLGVKHLQELSASQIDELVVSAADKVATACQKKISIVASVLRGWAGEVDLTSCSPNASDQESVLSSLLEKNQAQPDAPEEVTIFTSTLIQTQMGVDFLDATIGKIFDKISASQARYGSTGERPLAQTCLHCTNNCNVQ